jgi:lysophospholipase L1-like esterase
VLAPIVLAEMALRSLGVGNPILYYTNASYRYAQQPNQRQTRLRGASVTIDSKGLRATKDWTSRADAKILFVGDSVTWAGTYIDDNDTFSQGVCTRLERAAGKSYVCGSASANGYGTDNMAERIRYMNVDDETVLVVTLISPDTVRGLADADGQFLFTRRPPGPFRGLWEAATFATWRAFRLLRPLDVRQEDDDVRVAERSLANLFAALRETARPSRKVLIVLSPVRDELNGQESDLTRHVRGVLARSGFEVLDLHAEVSGAMTPDFYYDRLHLDVRGHRFYADRIAHRLEALIGR